MASGWAVVLCLQGGGCVPMGGFSDFSFRAPSILWWWCLLSFFGLLFLILLLGADVSDAPQVILGVIAGYLVGDALEDALRVSFFTPYSQV